MSSQATQRRSRTSASPTTTTTADSSSSASPTEPSTSPTFLARLQRLVDRDTEWAKPDLLDSIYWLRQALAVLCGPLFGLAGVTGAVGTVAFIALLMVGVFGWYGKYQQVDVEELGSWQLMSEGSWPAFALFVLLWTAFYSLDK